MKHKKGQYSTDTNRFEYGTRYKLKTFEISAIKQTVLVLVSLVALLTACSKNESPFQTTVNATRNLPIQDSSSFVTTGYTPPTVIPSKAILVDASKDGGVWWFPQSPTSAFSAAAPHQGKALADYLRQLGYQVDELPRGVTVTWSLLKPYQKIIRAGAFFPYSPSEVAAYDSFLNRSSSSLLLIQDHLTNTQNDALSVRLGLGFEGAFSGTVTQFARHNITEGVSGLPYIAGAVIKNPGKNITVLGVIDNSSYSGELSGPAVMGILGHPTSRIFFIGDINGLEQVPQPLTANLVKWLFE